MPFLNINIELFYIILIIISHSIPWPTTVRYSPNIIKSAFSLSSWCFIFGLLMIMSCFFLYPNMVWDFSLQKSQYYPAGIFALVFLIGFAWMGKYSNNTITDIRCNNNIEYYYSSGKSQLTYSRNRENEKKDICQQNIRAEK